MTRSTAWTIAGVVLCALGAVPVGLLCIVLGFCGWAWKRIGGDDGGTS